MAAIGDVWTAPIDFLEQQVTHYLVGGQQELTRRYRLDHPNSQYDVKKRGKYRPVVVMGYQGDPDRFIVAPLYSLHEGAQIVSLMQHQLSAQQALKQQGSTEPFIFTCVKIQPADVIPSSGAANQPGLSDISVARLDEILSVGKGTLDQRMGTLDPKVLKKLAAGYLKLAWSAGVPEALNQEFGYPV